jgi:hypothetical protein
MELFDDPRSVRFLQNDLAEAVHVMLQECSFISCKRLCVHFRLANATCLRILYDAFYKKIQFTLDSAHYRQQSTNRTGCTFFATTRSSDKPRTERVWSCCNKRQVMILFWISACSNLDLIARWDSRKNQTKKWYRNVSDFDYLSVNGIHSLLDVSKDIT